MPPQIRVQPGDLITADLINNVLERLEALEGKQKETKEKDTKEIKEKDTKEIKEKETKETDKIPDKVAEKTKEAEKIPDKVAEKIPDKVAEKTKEAEKIPDKVAEKPTEGMLPVLGVPGVNGSTIEELTPLPTEPGMIIDRPTPGRAFIRREERPLVGQRVLDEPGEPC
jgi:hypothetical protein